MRVLQNRLNVVIRRAEISKANMVLKEVGEHIEDTAASFVDGKLCRRPSEVVVS